MKREHENKLKLQIFSNTRFDVLYKGYIFTCVYDFECNYWVIYELWAFLADVDKLPYKCSSRLDCLHCLGWFYGE